TWQLWLARTIVKDTPLPWQKRLTSLSPGRVADSITALLARIGSPATDPKPRGKSPGWTTGRKRTQRPRYPTVRKRASKPKKKEKVAA
ncbi:NF041680 family putative transposase, partial [Acaryochloris marina NIES-2412]